MVAMILSGEIKAEMSIPLRVLSVSKAKVRIEMPDGTIRTLREGETLNVKADIAYVQNR
jgi:hypothetical protein